MSIPETFAQQMARVQQMADDADHRTWADLREDDRAALAALLESHDELRKALVVVTESLDTGPLQFRADCSCVRCRVIALARAAVRRVEGRS